jgi:Zn-dependent peptidase ImmA (M78 family)
MPARKTTIVETAQAILREHNVTRPPIPVEAIARSLGAKITHEPFDGNISAMLYRDGSRTVIGVNTGHPEVRQRFSLAHEIGHMQLHGKRQVFVDRLVRLDFRDDKSSTGTDQEEVEANAFAAELLMPRNLVIRAISETGLGPDDSVETLVASLADIFNVSQQAMDFRLVNLGIRGHV